MELKQIKELMAAMERAGIKKVRIKQKTGEEVYLEREEAHPPAPTFAHPVYPEHRFTIHPPHSHPKGPIGEEDKPAVHAEGQKEGKYVKSPMVGTFYASPSPEDPAFVKVGDRVEEGTVVCIIEAMKVMNEVKAGISGVIAEICVENAHPVEFGTKMFRLT